MQRQPRYRNQRLMDLCRDKECFLRFEGCQGWPTVPAHSNRLQDGRGVGLKTHDFYTVPACQACHYELDAGPMPRADKQIQFDRAWREWLYFQWAQGLICVAD